MKKITQFGGAIGIALSLSACGTLYKMDVAAYSSTDNDLGNTYVILSADPKMDVKSPEFELHAAQLERALEPKGFERVPEDKVQDAALGIYVSTNISDPSKRFHQVTTPVYNPGAGELGNTRGQNTDANAQTGRPQGTPDFPPPEPDVIEGLETKGFGTTVYTKRLKLRAVDLQRFLQDIKTKGRENAAPIEVWSVDIESTGQPNDLSEVIPIMIAAAQPYMADETDEIVRVSLSETDKRVAAIKGR